MQIKYKWLILIGGVFLIFIKRKSITEYTQGKVWDLASETRILTLHPKVRDKAREFINKAEKQNIKLRVSSAYRTHSEQNDLYAQGRTKAGKIVTYAKGGQSFHNFGTAIDVVPIVNGKADYNTDWNKIATIGKSVGFAWGGDNASFKDKAHFEMNFGNTLAQLQNKYNSGQLSGGFVQLA
jgi:peptidoglycan L-alanyl-D-glutamate endopeptidase CwlK